MTLYNLTKVVNVNSTIEFIQNVNSELMRGWFGIIILGFLFTVFFLSFMTSTKKPIQSLTGAFFISFIFSIILFIMSLVPIEAVWFTLICAGLGMAFWNLD